DNFRGLRLPGDVPTGGSVAATYDRAPVLPAGPPLGGAGALVSAGGRVLSIVGTGVDLTAAREAAYDRLAGIKLPGSHYRSDIGLAAVEGRIEL
ncbi:phosphoribosylglycinamide synthetase C domain-containing protein, partial [Nocardia carnea]|uniref:phosphoribosylglycinamide synthetase C domain-containing protein n=1 Tax=Nocardia carnea TaxID=37328 RepID=UPI002457B0A0